MQEGDRRGYPRSGPEHQSAPLQLFSIQTPQTSGRWCSTSRVCPPLPALALLVTSLILVQRIHCQDHFHGGYSWITSLCLQVLAFSILLQWCRLFRRALKIWVLMRIWNRASTTLNLATVLLRSRLPWEGSTSQLYGTTCCLWIIQLPIYICKQIGYCRWIIQLPIYICKQMARFLPVDFHSS